MISRSEALANNRPRAVGGSNGNARDPRTAVEYRPLPLLGGGALSSIQCVMPNGPNEGRLDSWKKIAVYLKRDITTVQRWEKREGMPVHRHVHDKMGSVYAFQSELDAWVHARSAQQTLNVAEPREQSAIFRFRWPAITLAVAVAAAGTALMLGFERTDHFWRNPLGGAIYQSVTGFDGRNEAAAVSRDGQFIAFLSDRGGRTDVWVTQVGSGRFHNLTRGVEGELVNPSIRELGFSPDGSMVTFWLRRQAGPTGQDISIWAVPTLGGEPRPYLEGAAEVTWSPDGNQLAYHTTLPGDPLFIGDGKGPSRSSPILIAPAGLHSHFLAWAPGNLIYFSKGSLPDQLDIWRVDPRGKALERITSHSTRVTYPVLLNQRTLLYLASAADGSGPWVYGMDVERRVAHRLTAGVEQYTSLAASADGHRVIATVSTPQRTLWRVSITDPSQNESTPARITLTTGAGFAPRVGPNYLLYVASAGTGESLWKISGTAATQLWAGSDARIIGAPAVSADGRFIAFTVRQGNQTLLYAMGSDGSRAHIVSDSLELRGAPAWAPDGRSIISAADENGIPHLFRIPLEGNAPMPFIGAYSVDPTWSSDGQFVIYSGPDIGTKFAVKAASAEGAEHPLPELQLTRGARHMALLPGGRKLVFLQGEIQHKNLWMVDLETGAMQQLTHMPAEFDVRDFDLSVDGTEAILERAQAHSDVVVIDRPAA
jgi:Tol biopolymer transport system component